jgi:hypothetical protein
MRARSRQTPVMSKFQATDGSKVVAAVFPSLLSRIQGLVVAGQRGSQHLLTDPAAAQSSSRRRMVRSEQPGVATRS